MPEVLFSHPDKPSARARMFTPARITSEKAWYKGARAVIPSIPDPDKTDWRIIETAIDIRYVKFRLVNGAKKEAWVTIDRSVSRL